ncbi:hypothetical protein [Luteimonas panaciterrae]|uniref:hypothetical protein n=1 Tax=Luteimonas panaciterrae TaxID=363885 RepID=UPI001CFBB6F5|nr:hypothetical protein [Luteimonas panaciterrae]
MPGEIIGEFILRPIAELVLQIAGYYTSRVVVPIFTFGYVHVEPAVKGVRVYPKWHGFHRTSDGRRVLDAEMGAFFGLVFWAVVGIATYLGYRYFAP